MEFIRSEEKELIRHIEEIVKNTVEKALNEMLDAEVELLCRAKRYERTEARKDTRAG